MSKKEIVQNWMRFAWREGNEAEIAQIPAEALAILKEQEPKEQTKPGKSSRKPLED